MLGLWQAIPSPPARPDPRNTAPAHKVGQDPARRRLGNPEVNLNLRSGSGTIGKRANHRLRQRLRIPGGLCVWRVPVWQDNRKRIRCHRYFRRQPLPLITFAHPADPSPVRFDKLQAEQHVGESAVPRHGDPGGEILVFYARRQPTKRHYFHRRWHDGTVYCTHGELALHANGSRADAAERERIANGRGWARTNRERARPVKSIFVCKFATAAFSYAASLSWRCSRAMTSRRGTTPCSSFTAGE